MSHRTKRDEAERKAQRFFLEDDRTRWIEGEARRHDQIVAKTKRLRELRLAREAADRVAAAKAKARKRDR